MYLQYDLIETLENAYQSVMQKTYQWFPGGRERGDIEVTQEPNETSGKDEYIHFPDGGDGFPVVYMYF